MSDEENRIKLMEAPTMSQQEINDGMIRRIIALEKRFNDLSKYLTPMVNKILSK